MGLGPLHTVSLAEARDVAHRLRQQLLEGVDPIGARDKTRKGRMVADTAALTFGQCCEHYVAAHESG